MNTPCFGSHFESDLYLCLSDEDCYHQMEYNRKFKDTNRYDDIYKSVYLNYYHFLEAMIHFEKGEEHLKILVDKIIQIKLKCSYLTQLIEEIINNFDLFSSSMAMLELFNYRLNFIENKLKTMSRDEPKHRFNYGFFSEMTYSQYSEEKFKIKRKIGICSKIPFF